MDTKEFFLDFIFLNFKIPIANDEKTILSNTNLAT